MKVLITGATGFIGKHLVKHLYQDKQYEISCLIRNPQKAQFLNDLGVTIIYADINAPNSFNTIPKQQFDILFHCAAHVNFKERELLFKTNVNGTENICALALKLNVKKLIYPSSVAVVSGNPLSPLIEDLPYSATNAYGESKIEAEKIVINYRSKGLPSVILRPCMIYGEDEPHALPGLFKILKYRLFPFINGGNSKLHLVYIENVIEAMLYAITHDNMLQGTYFVADNEVLTVKEIFTIFCQAIGAPSPLNIPNFINPFILNLPRVGAKLRFFLKNREYSINSLKQKGFTPSYPAEESLYKSAKALIKDG